MLRAGGAHPSLDSLLNIPHSSCLLSSWPSKRCPVHLFQLVALHSLPFLSNPLQVGNKIQLQKFRRSVVLCVVDVAGECNQRCPPSLPCAAAVVARKAGLFLSPHSPCAAWRPAAHRLCLSAPACTSPIDNTSPCPPSHMARHAVADFDGSLPRGALRSILPPDLRQGPIDVSRSLPLGFRLIVAVNKADLLPKQVTAARLEVGEGLGRQGGMEWKRVLRGHQALQLKAGLCTRCGHAGHLLVGPASRPQSLQHVVGWQCRWVARLERLATLRASVSPPQRWVRKRMAQGGLPRPSAVHIVSSTKNKGVRELLADVQTAVGVRGDVWVVGAQASRGRRASSADWRGEKQGTLAPCS